MKRAMVTRGGEKAGDELEAVKVLPDMMGTMRLDGVERDIDERSAERSPRLVPRVPCRLRRTNPRLERKGLLPTVQHEVW